MTMAIHRNWRGFASGAMVTVAVATGFTLRAADSDQQRSSGPPSVHLTGSGLGRPKDAKVLLELEPLPLKLPGPTLKGTPEDLPKGPNIEPPTEKPRPAFLAPKGARNLALHKKVTASDRKPINGDLSQITDGAK